MTGRPSSFSSLPLAPLTSFLLYAGLAVAATAVTWTGSNLLEGAAERLSTYHRLPATVQGAVVVAMGSSFPELSATVISTLVHGQFDLGVAAIVGSATFNVLVIPGLSGLIGKRLDTDRELVYKDAQFYIISVMTLLLVFSVAVVYHPVRGKTLQGYLTRPVAAVPLLLYGLYIFLQAQDARDHRARVAAGEEGDLGRVRPLWEWGKMAVSLALILAGVEGLIRVALGLGAMLETPSFLWGLTVIAIGTSLPDALVSIQAARRGNSVVSLANVLGSNIFDLLVAVPVGVMIAGATPVDFSAGAPMMIFLTGATVVLFAQLRTGLRLTRRECWLLLGLYGIFVLWMILETVGVTGIVFPG
jgi:cation:H+ antiporter